MDAAAIEAWIEIGRVAIGAGIQTAESLKTLFQSSNLADEATLDQIISEASSRKAARDAEAAKP